MAEKKILVYMCDRCGNEHKRSTRGKQVAPKGWVEVLSHDICDKCVPDLEAWLVGQVPERDDPEGVWVGNAPDGPVTVPKLKVHMGVDPNAPSVHQVIHGWGNGQTHQGPVDPSLLGSEK